MKRLIFILMVLNVICNTPAHAAPVEITEYIVKTNYGKFERCKVLFSEEHAIPSFKEGGGVDIRMNITNISTNWMIETTNLPISLTHRITYAGTNISSIVCIESVEPLDLPTDWKCVELTGTVSSIRVFRPNNFKDCILATNFFNLLYNGGVIITNVAITNQLNWK